MKIKTIILIIIDDVKADQFFFLMKNGELPNISNLFLNSQYSNKCVTTFPSTTLPSHVSIFTGRYQDYYKIPSIKWFDKKNKKLHDYTSGLEGLKLINDDIRAANVQTIYDKINDSSLVIFNGVVKGATHTNFNVIRSVSSNFKKFLDNNELPRLITCWYFESDEKMHSFGSNSKQYLRELKKIDRDIGKIIQYLKEKQVYDESLIIITSDHGNYSAERSIDVKKFFTNIGMSFMDDYYVDFGAVGFFYFKGNDWNDLTAKDLMNYGEKKLDLLKFVLDLPGVKYIAYKGEKTSKNENTIMVQGKKGVGKITQDGELTKYEFDGEDPLEYDLDENSRTLIDGNFHSIDEWLEHTFGTENIIVVDQLSRILTLDNSADIIAVTDGKTVYHHLHSHDLPTPECMRVPILIHHPNIKRKDLGLLKITEIHDIILNYLRS
ncbi:MAG: alkaline phosphatase family protein [Candidatus Helarchaeota archaeon]